MGEDDVYLNYLKKEVWARCCFCGAYNGKFGQPKQQHKPRCRYKGNANTTYVKVPNYFKMLEEDDVTHLEKLKVSDELKKAQKIIKIYKKRLEDASLSTDTKEKKDSDG